MLKLPKLFRSSPEGFTLIELMVVISIIAILSVIAFSIFNTAQASARDARRRLEISALGKNITATLDPSTGKYMYTNAVYTNDYPGTKPKDPNPTSNDFSYCMRASASPNSIPDPIVNFAGANWTVSACPNPQQSAPNYTSGWVALIDGSSGTFSDFSTGGGNPTGFLYWKLCTKLEATQAVYCTSSLIP